MSCAWTKFMKNEVNFIFDMFEWDGEGKRITEHACVSCQQLPITSFQEISTAKVYCLPLYPIAYIGQVPVWTNFKWVCAEMLLNIWLDIISNQPALAELLKHMRWFLGQLKKGPKLTFHPIKYAFKWRNK